jgi:hypothetical protein
MMKESGSEVTYLIQNMGKVIGEVVVEKNSTGEPIGVKVAIGHANCIGFKDFEILVEGFQEIVSKVRNVNLQDDKGQNKESNRPVSA